MRTYRLAVLLMGLVLAALASSQAKLDNAAILKMKAAGLEDRIIVAAIESTPGEYDTSADGLIALKAGGASEAVLAAILRQAGRASSTAPQKAPAAASGAYPDELGVYYVKEGQYVVVEPEIMSLRSTSVLKMTLTYGVKPVKYNGWIVGQHSKTVVGSGTTQFVLKVPEGVAPTEYTALLLKMKGDRREVELARARFSFRAGTEHSAVPFRYEKLDKGIYRISFDNLRAGEYALMPPGAEISKNVSSIGKVYSFGVIE
ncbi:MAG TPA: hypothetical protein VMG35_09505 [Bryobacteraceae bacterium]|nr:hypothetical protein [Bryobacteraceae bacterium]